MSKDNGIEELVIRKVNTLEIFVRYQSFFLFYMCFIRLCFYLNLILHGLHLKVNLVNSHTRFC